MAIQTSIITFKGKLAGISFYKRLGLILARRSGGVDKEVILSSPKFQRTRENMSEFGGASTSAKALRVNLAVASNNIPDPFLSSRLTKTFKQICDQNTGTRGQRSFLISAHPELLQDFELNINVPLSTILSPPFTITTNAARNQATLTLPAFDPSIYLNPPSGATHFRIILALGSISDFSYNAATNKYEPMFPLLNSLSAYTYSPYLSIASITPDQSLTANFMGSPTLASQVSVASCVGIQFSQQIGTLQYPLKENKAMKIIKLL